MTYPGMGVMIGMLGGNEENVGAWKKSQGKKITSLSVKDDTCRIGFATHDLLIRDEGQLCCEHRYMVCDDNLASFIGGTLLEVKIKGASPINGHNDCGEQHEIEFLHVKTSKGSFTVSNHNEHNGYYGGFHIILRTEDKRPPVQHRR